MTWSWSTPWGEGAAARCPPGMHARMHAWCPCQWYGLGWARVSAAVRMMLIMQLYLAAVSRSSNVLLLCVSVSGLEALELG